jgi:hypothetical protein
MLRLHERFFNAEIATTAKITGHFHGANTFGKIALSLTTFSAMGSFVTLAGK